MYYWSLSIFLNLNVLCDPFNVHNINIVPYSVCRDDFVVESF